MAYTLGQAARAAGKSKPTIQRAIKSGKLAAVRNDDGTYAIDPVELQRVYQAPSQPGNGYMKQIEPVHVAGSMPLLHDAIRDLRERNAEKDVVIDDLRRRLDEERTERRQTADRLAVAQERIAALLTDQRPARRSWWRW